MAQAPEHWIAEAYDAFGPDLHRHALLILADAALAEDAVQQAFMRLLARGRRDDLVSVKAFLRTVVRHEAYRLLARKRPADFVAQEARLLASVDQSLAQDEERRQLEQALRRLPAQQREVVQLKVWEQLTFGEIADLLGVSQNTAASRYRYALARLRDLLPLIKMETQGDDHG